MISPVEWDAAIALKCLEDFRPGKAVFCLHRPVFVIKKSFPRTKHSDIQNERVSTTFVNTMKMIAQPANTDAHIAMIVPVLPPELDSSSGNLRWMSMIFNLGTLESSSTYMTTNAGARHKITINTTAAGPPNCWHSGTVSFPASSLRRRSESLFLSSSTLDICIKLLIATSGYVFTVGNSLLTL